MKLHLLQYSEILHFNPLSGDLCKSGPRYFVSEKIFPQTLPNKLSLVTSKYIYIYIYI